MPRTDVDTSDDILIRQFGAVKNPVDACRLLVEHETFLGFDPYYRDLRHALIEMCARCGGIRR